MAATVIGATEIQVTSGVDDYLQVAELVADDFGGVDVAYAGNGGTVSALDQYSATSQPENAIDGAMPFARSYGDTPGIYHSGSTAGAYLDAFFAPATLSSLSIYGRTDCCDTRDIYNVTIFDAAGRPLYSGVLDADNADHVGTVVFDQPVTGIPEPETWALMLMGFGGLGALARRRLRPAPSTAV